MQATGQIWPNSLLTPELDDSYYLISWHLRPYCRGWNADMPKEKEMWYSVRETPWAFELEKSGLETQLTS